MRILESSSSAKQPRPSREFDQTTAKVEKQQLIPYIPPNSLVIKQISGGGMSGGMILIRPLLRWLFLCDISIPC